MPPQFTSGNCRWGTARGHQGADFALEILELVTLRLDLIGDGGRKTECGPLGINGRVPQRAFGPFQLLPGLAKGDVGGGPNASPRRHFFSNSLLDAVQRAQHVLYTLTAQTPRTGVPTRRRLAGGSTLRPHLAPGIETRPKGGRVPVCHRCVHKHELRGTLGLAHALRVFLAQTRGRNRPGWYRKSDEKTKHDPPSGISGGQHRRRLLVMS